MPKRSRGFTLRRRIRPDAPDAHRRARLRARGAQPRRPRDGGRLGNGAGLRERGRTASSSSWSMTGSPSWISATRWTWRSRSATRPNPSPLEPNFEVGEFGTPGDYRAFLDPHASRASTRSTSPARSTARRSTRPSRRVRAPSTTWRTPSPPSSPCEQPTTGELAERIDREVPRLTSSIGDVQAAANAAADDASSAKTLGLIGIIVGAIGLIVAIVALVWSGRRKTA